MKINPVTTARWLARISGSVALAVGIVYWLGAAMPLHAHMLFGGLLVLALVILAYGGRKRAPGLSLLAVVWGLAIPVVGMLQLHLPWDEFQWATRLAHVVIGVGGVGLAEIIATRARQS